MSKRGGGYYFDLRQPNIGGRPVYSGYDDFAPPIFVGELIKDEYTLGVGNIPAQQKGASRLNKKIKKRGLNRRKSSKKKRI